MKVIVENKIPYLAEELRKIPGIEVVPLAGADITPLAVRDADALMVRTRTRCDAILLEGSKVRFIGTATIGTDHIDLPWCHAAGITVANAPGCNAPAVAQWVMAAIEAAHPAPGKLTLGIIGVGHVGSIVSAYARSLGMSVLECDPPKGLPHSLTDVASRADILTFHTPLDSSTRHMFSPAVAALMRPGAVVLNAARGPVTDTAALLMPHLRVGIDCWEGEPEISRPLLDKAFVATPHIAGYSAQGKQRASMMILNAFRSFIGLPPAPFAVRPAAESIFPGQASASYDILADTAALKAAPELFESLRNNYNLRNEI